MKDVRFKTIAALFILFITNGLSAQNAPTIPNQLVLGKRDVVHSAILGEDRNIWIYVPASASAGIYLKPSYPVVYLLDGANYHFTAFTTMIRQLGSTFVIPEMIVVGIPNTDRTRDLTPTHVDSWQFLDMAMDNDICKTSGGGEKFLSFIEKELIPHIDSVYPTAPYRLFFGHSFGGLTVMNAFVKNTNLFNAYVSVDPAMSWDNQKLLAEARQALAGKSFQGVSLYLATANTLQPGMDTARAKKDKSILTEHFRSNLELRDNLNKNPQNKLNWAFRYYGNDNHNSVLQIAEYDALRFLFNFYPFNIFNFSDYRNLDKHFEMVSKRMGYTVKPPESMVNSLAYTVLSFKRKEEAYYLFELNIKNYPGSFNVFDSMAEFHEINGDKEKAIDYYKKALEVKEVPATRQKLEKLMGKQ